MQLAFNDVLLCDHDHEGIRLKQNHDILPMAMKPVQFTKTRNIANQDGETK